jgi:geranylgeranyl pyrophosphate synthase
MPSIAVIRRQNCIPTFPWSTRSLNTSSAQAESVFGPLVVLLANAYGYHGTEHHQLAAIVEFIHTATLLHDDVVDESSMRRGRKTANALFGNAASCWSATFSTPVRSR